MERGKLSIPHKVGGGGAKKSITKKKKPKPTIPTPNYP